jgi:hypothetical protein
LPEISVKSLAKKSVGTVVLLITTTLLAQPAPQSPVPTAVPADVSGANQMTPAEMVPRVQTVVAESLENHRRVTLLQIQARKQKDVIKLNCIHEKLLQIKALRNILDSLTGEFESASDTGKYTSYDRIIDNTNQIRKLREEAQLCAGEIELYTESKGDFSGPDIPDDPGKDLFPGDVEPPGYASPYN